MSGTGPQVFEIDGQRFTLLRKGFGRMLPRHKYLTGRRAWDVHARRAYDCRAVGGTALYEPAPVAGKWGT